MVVDLAQAIGSNLPYLRRYARALTGSQTEGDRYAAETLEAVVQDVSADPDWPAQGTARSALFQAFHVIWAGRGGPVADMPDSTLSAQAQRHLARVTAGSREALLLNSIEGFSFDEIGLILGVDAEMAERLVDTAIAEMADSVVGRVLVIEDEPIIAMDIGAIVTEMGHEVIGVARTRQEAVGMGTDARPDLILADIQLADNSSGIDAVHDILEHQGEVPVVFITAFPERLLTGSRPEPAFLITKPYSETQVRSAVSQAMFFASTETLMRS